MREANNKTLDGHDRLPGDPPQLADENKACQIASDIDGRAWFMAWGTCHKDSSEPGVLNKHNLT